MKCSVVALLCMVVVLGVALNGSVAMPQPGGMMGGGGGGGGGGGKHGGGSNVIEILAAGLIAKLLSEMHG